VKGVKVIQCLLAGVDWILPLLPKGVVLCDGQGIHNIPVAEWIVGAVLGSLKRFPEFRDRQHEGFWDGQVRQGVSNDAELRVSKIEIPLTAGHSLPYRVLGEELTGKNVLIVGYGSIGAELERMLHGFQVEILRVARTAKPEVSPIGDLEKLLPEADIVVLLVPLTAETRGMMNAAALARMKSGALLVNAARGPVVDMDALLAELHAGRLRAALDVMDPEPLPLGHPLWSAPNCFLTPHIGASVEGFAVRGYRFAAEQVRRYLAGEPLKNRVQEAGY
jgi:phosphoglycerate dehydrogenase-like enzyme